MQMQGCMEGVMVREYLRFFVLHLCMLVLFNKCMLAVILTVTGSGFKACGAGTD